MLSISEGIMFMTWLMLFLCVFYFVLRQQQVKVPEFSSVDGYGFTSTAYEHMYLPDTHAAVAAFKQAFSQHVDR